jgi:HK97 family phage prohead protease
MVGYASVFGKPTTLRDDGRVVHRETIVKGAFSFAIAKGQDVRCLFNHDPSKMLGRTTAGTLRLREDAQGLWIECDLPETQLARDVASLIARGDVTGQSFAFIPRETGMTRTVGKEGVRTIVEDVVKSVDLFDVGPVAYPAYDTTSILVRGGIIGADELERLADEDVRRRLRKLEARTPRLMGVSSR